MDATLVRRVLPRRFNFLGKSKGQKSAPRSLEAHLASAALARELGGQGYVWPHLDKVTRLAREQSRFRPPSQA